MLIWREAYPTLHGYCPSFHCQFILEGAYVVFGIAPQRS